MYSFDRLDRREFVRALAATGASSLLLPGNLAQGMTRQARSKVLQPYNATKGAFYEGLVATRCADCTASNGAASCMARTSHKAIVDIRKLKIAVQNFIVTPNGGTEGPSTGSGTSTITASVEYPSGVFRQILFRGYYKASLGVQSIMESDYVEPALMIPANATFWIRQFQVNTTNMTYADGSTVGALNANTGMGDIFQFSSPTDMTMGGTITQGNAGKYTFPPAAIIGMTNKPSVIVVGDSIGRGLHEVASITDQRAGLICRAFPADTLAFLNHASSSAKAATFLSWSPLRRTLWKYGSHLVDQMGINDVMFGGDSAATVEFNCRTNLWSQMHPRAKIIRTTLTPFSNSAGNLWATAADQMTFANNGVKNTFNGNVRAGMKGVFAYWETAWALENSHDDGLWITDGNVKTYTDDGLHPYQTAGNNAGSAAVNMADIYW